MPSRPWSSSGYRSVHARPFCVLYVEICFGYTRLRLGTFETAHEAVHAYDTAVWRPGQPRAQMNFNDIFTREQAHVVVPSPRVVTEEDRRVQRNRERRLMIVERDEDAMTEWPARFLEDVAAKNEF